MSNDNRSGAAPSAPKPHADIIAEMRYLAANRDWHNHTGQSNREHVSYLADRLEAAHKREVNELKKSIGNAAKLREALSKFCAYSAVVLNTGMFNRVHLEALLNMAKAALAAPARNCDIYATVEEARKVWCGAPSRDWDYLCDWLYAITKETEATNGNE